MDLPQSRSSTGKWVAFTHLENGTVSAKPLARRPPMGNPSLESQLHTIANNPKIDVLFTDGSLRVYRDDAQAWRSDPTWDVRQMLVADADNDGQQELAFVVWKPFALEPRFLYHTFRFSPPFQEGSLRNHLFIYGWSGAEWRPVWCSSPIADPIRELAVGDLDGDGANELAVLEGSYDAPVGEPARHITVWRWNGWGFTLQWRSPRGRYADLTLQDVTGDGVPEIVLRDAL